MANLLDDLDRWRQEQVRVAVARVVDMDGPASQAADPAMAVNERGEVVGSVPGGSVEAAVVAAALAVLEEGHPKLVSFGLNHPIHVFFEPLDW